MVSNRVTPVSKYDTMSEAMTQQRGGQFSREAGHGLEGPRARLGLPNHALKLLPLQANANAQTHLGHTSLHYAVMFRSYGVVETLLKHGADESIVGTGGRLMCGIYAYKGDKMAF